MGTLWYQKPTFIIVYNLKYWRGSYIVMQSDVEMNRRPWTNHFTVHLCIKLGALRYMVERGSAVAQWLRRCPTNRKAAGSIPAVVIGFFIDIKSFRSNYGPGVYSTSNRNKYQEYFLGVKAAGA